MEITFVLSQYHMECHQVYLVLEHRFPGSFLPAIATQRPKGDVFRI
jgi:hypothetical protein